MKEYKLRKDIKIQKYEKGMENGWRVHYWYKNYNDMPLSDCEMTFKDIKDLEIWKDKMERYSDPENMIHFEKTIPVIETVNGLAEIVSGKEYVTIDSNGDKRVFTEEVFEFLFEKI